MLGSLVGIIFSGVGAYFWDKFKLETTLEKLVLDSIEAEWAVYQKLPIMDLSFLDSVFAADGSAYKRIAHIADRHHIRNWTISNPLNPSTKQLIDIKVEKISSTNAVVHTKEKWLLKWWSNDNHDYAFNYDELNEQDYFLVCRNGEWLVLENIYPPPKVPLPVSLADPRM